MMEKSGKPIDAAIAELILNAAQSLGLDGAAIDNLQCISSNKVVYRVRAHAATFFIDNGIVSWSTPAQKVRVTTLPFCYIHDPQLMNTVMVVLKSAIERKQKPVDLSSRKAEIMEQLNNIEFSDS